MKSLGLLCLVTGVLLVTALVSPWAAWGLGARYTFARVFDRVFEISLVGAVLLCWRALDLGDAAALGFRRREWVRALATGGAIGIAAVSLGLGLCGLFGALTPALRFSAGKTLYKAVLGLTAALAIGAGEETLFRGMILRRLRRDVGPAAGVAVTTAIYAAVHVIRRRGSAGVVHAASGFEQLAGLLAPLADVTVLPELVGLAFLGAVLAAARLRAGTLWLPIGVHAAFVAAFRVGRLFFRIGSEPAWLVGTGWPPLMGGIAGWIAVALAGGLVLRQTR